MSQETDSEYYDMAEHLKDCYDKMENKMNTFKEENDEYKKIIMVNYSLFRLLSNELDNALIDQMAVGHLVELGRSLCSETIHENML